MTNAKSPRRPKALVPAHVPAGAEPAKFSSSVVAALQALSSGTANDGQQKLALKWILEGACQLPVWAYCTDDRSTHVALGRQFVGQQIMGLLKMNLSAIRQREDRGDEDAT